MQHVANILGVGDFEAVGVCLPRVAVLGFLKQFFDDLFDGLLILGRRGGDECPLPAIGGQRGVGQQSLKRFLGRVGVAGGERVDLGDEVLLLGERFDD